MQVRVENLYYLLCYAWRHFHERELVEVSAEEVQTPEGLFARMLASAAGRIFRQHLDRGYREEVDELRRPRGKIQLAQTIARGTELRGRLECTFDDATEDVLHNRIIKATARRLATVKRLTPQLRYELRVVVERMARVADALISPQDFQRVQLHSNLQRYRFA